MFMKKLIFIILIILIPTLGMPNAAPMSEAVVTEVYFDENGDWTIELYFFYHNAYFDSAYVLFTSTDTATFKKFPDNSNFLLITKEDLDQPIDLNIEGDRLYFYTMFDFCYWERLTRDYYIYGDFPGSEVNSPYPGQSLVGLIRDVYGYYNPPVKYEVKDTASSLGFLRDPARGTLQGYVVDSTGNPMPYIRVLFKGPAEMILWTDEQGQFTASCYARNDTVCIMNNGVKLYEEVVTIEPDSVTSLIIQLPVSNTVDVNGQCFLDESSNHSGTMVIFAPECPFAPFDTAFTNTKGLFKTTLYSGHYYIRYSHGSYYPKYYRDVRDIFSTCGLPVKTLEEGNVYEVDRGNVSGRWDPYMPYWIFGDITIPAGDTLILDPGVRLEFKRITDFNVYGTLFANGNENDQVSFIDGIENYLKWNGLTFYDSTSSGSVLDHVLKEKSNNGLRFINASPTVMNSPLGITYGIYILDNATPVFCNNYFVSLVYPYFGTWITVEQSAPVFHHNFFINYSIWARTNSKPHIYNNDFFDSYIALSWDRTSEPRIINNVFHLLDYALNGESGDTVTDIIRHNLFGYEVDPVYRRVNLPGFGKKVQKNINGDLCDAYFNLFKDPFMIDPEGGNYRLRCISPCIDAGDPTFPYDPDSTIADIGALYFDQITADMKPVFISKKQCKISHYPNPVKDYVNFVVELPDNNIRQLDIIIFNDQGIREATIHLHQNGNSNNVIVQKLMLSSIPVLSAGTKVYCLVGDGTLLDSDKMVVLK